MLEIINECFTYDIVGRDQISSNQHGGLCPLPPRITFFLKGYAETTLDVKMAWFQHVVGIKWTWS